MSRIATLGAQLPLRSKRRRGVRAERPHSTDRPTANGGSEERLARGEGRRLTYPSKPRDHTGAHARFRSLNFELSLLVSPPSLKEIRAGGLRPITPRQLTRAATSPCRRENGRCPVCMG